MAPSFDSQLAASALLLFAAALFAWTRAARASVRLNLRFAAVLFASLAVSACAASLSPDYAGLALAVAALVAGLGSAALGLCVFAHLSRRPPPLGAGLALGAGLLLGLAAALSGQMIFALAAMIPAAAVMMALGFGAFSTNLRPGVQSLLGGLALLCGGMALMEEALPAALLFFAAGLMGVANASRAPVQQQGAAGLISAVKSAGR